MFDLLEPILLENRPIDPDCTEVHQINPAYTFRAVSLTLSPCKEIDCQYGLEHCMLPVKHRL